ncbi:MAG: Spx/MgsR family RNA polymerase-binding regulatory protein [Candidatus Izemoplasmatales bacterium]|jgi:regulatory protein spx|nr:Spx/MgsR family RNA polymerase-binding regulatory protein [Candidatus Izemoplasmatales bacterium]MDD3865351.1 Spx/MgsR family RNA polymerase-binding regulatory protein [Candidatus Izemoplasmatales bacterium]
MITLYTSSSCSSCRKAKKWFEDNKIPFKEKNIVGMKLTREDIIKMLKFSENGFEDIISTRSKIFKDTFLNTDEMLFGELADFIINNPTILKRPIIVNDKIMQTGYNEDEIRAFIPKQFRESVMCTECQDDCEYKCAVRAGVQNLTHTRAL